MNDGLLPRWTGGGCVALVLRPLPLRLGSAGCCCAAGMLGCGVFQLMAVCLDLLGGCAACFASCYTVAYKSDRKLLLDAWGRIALNLLKPLVF